MNRKWTYYFLSAVIILSVGYSQKVPSPQDVFGFRIGDDYKLADHSQMVDYYKKLANASDRVQLTEVGKSALGRPMILLFISTPENLQQLDKWKSISAKLARARVSEDEAEKLVKEGKSILWIDGGMHATERAHGQMTSELAYRVATEESDEMKKIRENVILLLMPVINPDGMDIVVDWYRRNLGTPFETTGPPWLYHHYVGHDNNRDWFMNNMPESQACSRVIYNEWYPQIIYNHHQTGPSWARIFLPPFSDPVNPNIHPGVTTGVSLVGTAMGNRFAMKKMGGVVSDFQYSMWWNGGMRTAPYFHNQIGILTETSHATPTPRFYDPDSIPKAIGSRRANRMSNDGTDIFLPLPWEAGESHFRDAVDYMLTASMAVMNISADLREKWLMNIYTMGRDAIESGEAGGPYAYVIPTEQWDGVEATNLVTHLRRTGIEVHQSTGNFTVGGKKYEKGSYIIYAAQAYRPMVVDMMEPQKYPDRRNADGTPQVPYDLAGWTLPMQMGITVDRVEASFKVKAEEVTDIEIAFKAGTILGKGNYGYALSNKTNASFLAVNRLLDGGAKVHYSDGSFKVRSAEFGKGAIVVESSGKETDSAVNSLAKELGVSFTKLSKKPSGKLVAAKPFKVGLYKSWVSNMDEGWTRWLLENYEFSMDTLHDADIRGGQLNDYNAIVIPDQSPNRILNGHAMNTMPQEYVGGIGVEGSAALKKFVEDGGTLVMLDGASDFAIEQFGLPVKNVVSGVSPQKFFIPGSLVRIHLKQGHPLTAGMQDQASAYFVRSRAFSEVKLSRKGEGGREDTKVAPKPPVEVVASYDKEKILMSGWALGEKSHIGDKAAAVRVKLGEGDVVLIGFRPQFRGQPRGTYKLLFNSLLLSGLDAYPTVSK